MRLFFAVTLPEEIIARTAAQQEELRAKAGDEGIKWTRPEQFHYTLKFLGEQPALKAHKAAETAKAVAVGAQPFELTLGGVGAFPNSNRPSVLWLGATSGAELLIDLATRLEMALVRQGFSRENKPPKAHLTLARMKTYAGETAAARLLRGVEVGEVGAFTVDRFVLMQSTLKPSGSEYAVVEQFTFGG
jgi:RNA 2',3'-cyclic 3'-phosphodiesterase